MAPKQEITPIASREADARVLNPKKKEYIMGKENKVSTSNANVSENATKVASVKVKEDNVMKVNSLNKNDMINEERNNILAYSKVPVEILQEESDCGCPPEESHSLITVRVMIDNKEKTIIPAFTEYNMEQPKKKEGLLELTDKNKMLDVIFHFAKPEVFYSNGVSLYDRNGNKISPETPDVFVVCDTADTYWRIFKDDVLKNVQIHDFKSVEEYAQTVGNTMLLSRGLNNVERVGYAALATGDEAYKTAFRFARKNNMNISNALTYLDIRMKSSETQLMTLGIEPKTTPVLGRTEANAQRLFEQTKKTFGEKEAKQRYAVRAVNTLISYQKYGFELMMEALQTIPADEIANAKLMGCGAKESCITTVLTEWLITLQRQKENNKAA